MNGESDVTVIGDPRRDPAFATLREQQRREQRGRRRLRLAIAATVGFHLALALLSLPGQHEVVAATPAGRRQVVRLVTLPKLAPPTREEPRPRTPEVIKVPIPDPTPLDPEPVREPQPVQVADLPRLGRIDGLFDDLVPGPPRPAAVRPGGEISEPRKIHDVLPVYPEEARMARLQGTVILDVTLDELGLVRDIHVLKPLSLGLTEAALDAVKQWRYEPSRLDGEPVQVMMTVTVTFRLA